MSQSTPPNCPKCHKSPVFVQIDYKGRIYKVLGCISCQFYGTKAHNEGDLLEWGSALTRGYGLEADRIRDVKIIERFEPQGLAKFIKLQEGMSNV